jgi:anti-sigma B factor antagonist
MPDLNIKNDVISSARMDGQSLVVSVQGDIDLHNSPDLRDVLLEALARHRPSRVILNLANVPYMDSSAIAVLVETLQKMRKTGGKVCLTQLQPRVKGLLELARLDTLFLLAKDEEEAKKK